MPSNTTESPLTVEECASATPILFNRKPFRVVNRKLVDPHINGAPRFGLWSFAKAVGATPDKDGFFGVAKLRGAFYTEAEAADKAEQLIKDVDSANSIFTVIFGEPFPVTDTGFSRELTEIDISNKVQKVISENVRAKRNADEKEMNQILERERALVNDDGTINESVEPEEMYVQQRVKLAHLRYAIKEHALKFKECTELEKTVRKNLLESKAEHPEYEEGFVKRYQTGRRKANISAETDFTGFMRYLVDPIEVDEREDAAPSYIS